MAEKIVKKVKDKKPNAVKRWWRETTGELRKVSWPSTQEAIRMTKIVLAVMVAMAATLGVLDYIFSTLIGLILT